MRLSWVCFCLLLLLFWRGFLLFRNFKPVCCSTKRSAEVCKFLVFLEAKGRNALLAARNSLSSEGVIWSLKSLFALVTRFHVTIVSSCNYETDSRLHFLIGYSHSIQIWLQLQYSSYWSQFFNMQALLCNMGFFFFFFTRGGVRNLIKQVKTKIIK